MNDLKLIDIDKEILLELYAEEIIFLFIRSIKILDDDGLHRAHKAILEEFNIREFGVSDNDKNNV